MRTTIWYKGKARNVHPSEPPKDSRELNSFVYWNGAGKCFVKQSGGWYKITKDNKFLYVERTLYLLSLAEWLEVALDDNFTANIRLET
jgi:hypothetical protein